MTLASLEVSYRKFDRKKMNEASKKDNEYNRLQSEIARIEKQEDQPRDRPSKGPMRKSGLDAGICRPSNATPPPPVPVPRGTLKHLLSRASRGNWEVVGLILFPAESLRRPPLVLDRKSFEHFSEPILGQIPDVSDSRGSVRPAAPRPRGRAITRTPRHFAGPSALRSSFMPNQAELKTLIVTSAISKRRQVHGLPAISARNDGCLPAPACCWSMLIFAAAILAQLFDIEGKFGLTNILRGEAPWKEAVRTTKYPIPFPSSRAARSQINPGELLLRPAMFESAR